MLLPLVGYMAHPVGAPTDDGVHANLQRAKRWLKWLVAVTQFSVSCVWISYCEALDDHNPAHRARGMIDDEAQLRRADCIILVGGRISTGMANEVQIALVAGIPILDLTHLGDEPPLEETAPPELEIFEKKLLAAAARTITAEHAPFDRVAAAAVVPE